MLFIGYVQVEIGLSATADFQLCNSMNDNNVSSLYFTHDHLLSKHCVFQVLIQLYSTMEDFPFLSIRSYFFYIFVWIQYSFIILIWPKHRNIIFFHIGQLALYSVCFHSESIHMWSYLFLFYNTYFLPKKDLAQ